MRRRAGFALLCAVSIMALPMAALAEEAEPETEAVVEAEAETEAVIDAEADSKEEAESDPIAIPYDQEGAWDEVAMTNDDAVKTGINIRASADEEGEIIGFLYRGGAAWVLNKGEEWTELCSGDLTGFVKNEYLLYGRDVTGLAEHYGRDGVATIWNEVKLFASEDGSSDENVVEVLETGASFPLVHDNGHWLEIQYSADETAFVSEDDVVRVILLDTAITKDGISRSQAGQDDSYEEEVPQEEASQEETWEEAPQEEEVWTAPETEAPAPQTEAPAPQTEAPAPQTEAPAPQTEAPAPQTEAPAPQTEAPAVDISEPEEPVTEAPAEEPPQTEAPAETPVTEAPAETPVTEAPAETPVTEAPTADEPQADEPGDDEGDLAAEGYYDADTDTYYDSEGKEIDQSSDASSDEGSDFQGEEFYDADADTGADADVGTDAGADTDTDTGAVTDTDTGEYEEEVMTDESSLENVSYDSEALYEGASAEEPVYEEGSYEEAATEDSVYEEGSYEEASAEDPVYEEGSDEGASAEEPAYEEDSYEETSGETGEASAEEPEAASASADDASLLAALIYNEAGNQSYEGMVAVGAVVMNRVSSSSFPDSISEVIYQSGQFTPASSGALASSLASGVPSTCYEAAEAAIEGENPVGDALYFNTGSGSGQKIGDHQFF